MRKRSYCVTYCDNPATSSNSTKSFLMTPCKSTANGAMVALVIVTVSLSLPTTNGGEMCENTAPSATFPSSASPSSVQFWHRKTQEAKS